MQRNSTIAGFSLIEVVVVIIVIGILAATILPRVLQNTESAHYAAAQRFATVLTSSLNTAANEWYVNVKPEREMDVTGDRRPDFLVNDKGYPLHAIDESDMSSETCLKLIDYISGGRMGMTLQVMSTAEIEQYFQAQEAQPNLPTYGVSAQSGACLYTYLPLLSERIVVTYNPAAQPTVMILAQDADGPLDGSEGSAGGGVQLVPAVDVDALVQELEAQSP